MLWNGSSVRNSASPWRTCRVVQMIASRRPYSAAVSCGGRHIERIAHAEQRAAGCLAASARVTARSGIVGRGVMDTSAAQAVAVDMSHSGSSGVVHASVHQGFDDAACGVEFDGLVEEIVGSGRRACLSECRRRVIRQHDRDNARRGFRQRPDQVEAAAVRQPQVDDHDIRLAAADVRPRVLAVFRLAHDGDTADRADEQRDPLSDGDGVIDEKHPERGGQLAGIHAGSIVLRRRK
ncbi:hypothetical protein BC2230_11328 [Burkholderia cepacia]